MAIEIFVPGIPCGGARARGGKTTHHYTADKQRAAGEMIAYGAKAAMKGRPLITGPVRLNLIAVYPWPKSWSTKKRAANPWKITKPDGDNLQRSRWMPSMASCGWMMLRYANGPVRKTTVRRPACTSRSRRCATHRRSQPSRTITTTCPVNGPCVSRERDVPSLSLGVAARRLTGIRCRLRAASDDPAFSQGRTRCHDGSEFTTN